MAWFDIITDGWQYVHLINLDARGASVRCASLGIICAALVLLQPHTYRLDDVLCGSSFPLTSFLCALRHRLPIHATAQHTTVPLSHGLQPVSSQKQKCFFQISNTLRRATPPSLLPALYLLTRCAMGQLGARRSSASSKHARYRHGSGETAAFALPVRVFAAGRRWSVRSWQHAGASREWYGVPAMCRKIPLIDTHSRIMH
jgi:hypothetical protein